MRDFRVFLQAFLLISLCTTFIALFSFSGAKAMETFFPKQDYFPEGTMVSSVPIGGLTKQEAKELLINEIDTWKNNTNIQFVYFDEEVSFAASNVEFFIEESLQLIGNGSLELYTAVSTNGLIEALEGFSYFIDGDELNLEALEDAVKVHAQNLATNPLYIDVNKGTATSNEIERVAETVISNVESTLLLPKWVSGLDGFVIEGKATFSLLNALEKIEALPVENESLNVLATALYETFLQTNFHIRERYTGLTLPAYARLGYHAVVIPDKFDLVIENPNYYPFILKLSFENDQLSAALEGVSFPYQYETVTKNERVIEPRKIVHFSARRQVGDRQVIKGGEDGYIVEVYRQEKNKATNALLTEQFLFEDFYPPVHEVVEWSLQDRPTDEQSGNSDAETQDPTTVDGDGREQSPGEPSNGEPEETGSPATIPGENDVAEDELDFEEPHENTKGY